VSRSFVVNLFWLTLGIIVAAVVIGAVTLWPGSRTVEQPPGLLRPQTERAEVVAIAAASCPAPGQTACRRLTAELREGE
jgi:hypothetical protein